MRHTLPGIALGKIVAHSRPAHPHRARLDGVFQAPHAAPPRSRRPGQFRPRGFTASAFRTRHLPAHAAPARGRPTLPDRAAWLRPRGRRRRTRRPEGTLSCLTVRGGGVASMLITAAANGSAPRERGGAFPLRPCRPARFVTLRRVALTRRPRSRRRCPVRPRSAAWNLARRQRTRNWSTALPPPSCSGLLNARRPAQSRGGATPPPRLGKY